MSINSPLRNEQFDTGSNYNFYEKMLKTGIPRSLFDLSHLVTTTLDNAGKVVPLSVIPTLPGDDMDISVTALLRVMPQMVPLYSRQRLYIYAFWSRNSDLWCNWQTFTKRGLSGNEILHMPNIGLYKGLEASSPTIKPGSLGDMVGFPIGAPAGLFNGGLYSAPVHALPLMMYLRIWRDYFCDPNYFMSDRIIFPNDDSRFRLDDDGNLLSAKDLSGNGVNYVLGFDICGNFDNIFYHKHADWTDGTSDMYSSTYTDLVVSLFYHDFAPDRFTTALPFAQRGDIDRATIYLDDNDAVIPSLDVVQGSDFAVSGSKFFISPTNDSSAPAYLYGRADRNSGLGYVDSSYTDLSYINWPAFDNMLSGLSVSGLKTQSQTVTVSGLHFNIDDLRQIIIAESEMEKMARTDGSYGQFVETFFNVRPKSAYDYRPVFIGGTHQNLLFTEVLQQSSSVDKSPLGSYAGHGISGAGDNGYLGHLKSDDYGYLMILACVMPDVYYSQGLDKHWTVELQTDLYLPERSEIGLQPVFNYELYYQAHDSINTGLFGYNDPFDEFRYIPNRIHGKIADSTNESFYPYTQARKFSSTPTLGRAFSEARQVRKDYLAAPVEDAYSCQFDINIRAIRPLPYKSTPALFV